MKIPDKLKTLASRIGNKTMIEQIKKENTGLDDDWTLVFILPSKRGIMVEHKDGAKATLLVGREVGRIYKTESKKKSRRRKREE